MAEVMDVPVDGLDRRPERSNDIPEKSGDDVEPSSPPPPPPPPPQSRRGRDRDSRERRDERDFDRRGGRGDYSDRNRSPPPPPLRERDHKRNRTSSSPPPPPYRDRRRSPPPYKRSRRDEYDGRRGSPRGGYGPGERRSVLFDVSLYICVLYAMNYQDEPDTPREMEVESRTKE